MPLDWACAPTDVVAAWPADVPLAALVSAGRCTRWSRWSILAAPAGEAVDWRTMAGGAPRARPVEGPDVVVEHDGPPFAGGWIGYLSYDLGRKIEPKGVALQCGAVDDRGWPLSEWRRCPAAYVHDALRGRWWAVGDRSALPAIDPGAPPERHARFRVGPMTSGTRRDAYVASVARAMERIHAGDVFQVNLAHRLSGGFKGSARGLFRRLTRAMGPWCSALLDCDDPGRALVSASPELFLSGDLSTGRLVTRPIKGTAPAAEPASRLALSEKDAAELVMIVDLMRNDLGRVAEYGSVRVDSAREIERHGGPRGVRHGVATVSARLRAGAGVEDVIRAAFPPGSITGAPKVRAMRVIDELEPVRRGPYCGSIGYVSDCGAFGLSVAIRTACVQGAVAHDGAIDGLVDAWVGAGIVADSDPAREWDETMHKAAGMLDAVTPRRRAGSGA